MTAPTTLDLLNIPQLAEYLGVSEPTIRRWRDKRIGPPGFQLIKAPGSPVVYRRAEVDAWVKQREDDDYPPPAPTRLTRRRR